MKLSGQQPAALGCSSHPHAHPACLSTQQPHSSAHAQRAPPRNRHGVGGGRVRWVVTKMPMAVLATKRRAQSGTRNVKNEEMNEGCESQQATLLRSLPRSSHPRAQKLRDWTGCDKHLISGVSDRESRFYSSPEYHPSSSHTSPRPAGLPWSPALPGAGPYRSHTEG